MVLSVLDEVLHTPAVSMRVWCCAARSLIPVWQSTFARCPFLFTVICATSARYYAKKPELYPVAMHFARESAGRALTHAYKSIELCQAYIIMVRRGRICNSSALIQSSGHLWCASQAMGGRSKLALHWRVVASHTMHALMLTIRDRHGDSDRD